MMVVIAVSALVVMCLSAIIDPTSPYERLPAVIFLSIGLAALALEIGFMLGLAGAGVPLVIGSLLVLITIIGNVVVEHLALEERLITGGMLGCVLIVIAGHVRWFLILQGQQVRGDSN